MSDKVRLSESPWIVTSRRKVHERRTCASARRVAFPSSWLPSVQRPEDHACVTCLGGMLPTQDELDAPLTVGCSQCGAEPREECRGGGEGYHLSRYDRLAEPCVCDTGFTCLAVAHDASSDCPHDEWFEEGDEDGGTGWTCASCGKHDPRPSLGATS